MTAEGGDVKIEVMTETVSTVSLADGGAWCTRSSTDAPAGLPRPWSAVVWTVGAAAAVVSLASLALFPVNRHVPEAGFSLYAVPDLTAGVLYSLIGAWLSVRRPDNAMGWLLLVSGLSLALSAFGTQYGAAALLSMRSHHLPLATAGGAVGQFAYLPGNVIGRTLLVYAFPDVPLRTRAGRAVLAAAVLGALTAVVYTVGLPSPSYGPFHVAAWAGAGRFLLRWQPVALGAVTAACTLALLGRLRRAAPPRRGALAWFSVAAVINLAMFSAGPVGMFLIPGFHVDAVVGPVLIEAAAIAFAVSSVVAVLHYRLWDFDVVLRRSLVFAALTAALAAGYLGLVAAADAVFPRGGAWSSVAAALVVAGVVAPLRSWLQRGVDHLLYGDRSEPDAAVARLGRRLGTTADADELLPEVAGVIAASLRVPYVAVAVLDDGGLRLSAEYGRDVCGTESIRLTANGEAVGRLVVGRREPGVALDHRDLRLLDDLARQAAVAVDTVQRGEELQRSRQRLVGAREEERRRLRRDLHDGLGPALAAITLQLDEAAELVDSDPAAARQLLHRLRGGTQDLIADVRRLVYDLRPPTLDELGLVGALRVQAVSLTGRTSFEVVADPDPVNLPAAVEVALLRIAGEAMTNVARHARARHCVVRLRVDGRAELDVADDGRGLDGSRIGVGLASARERAAELGGACSVARRPDGGTVLHAVIPLTAGP